MTETAGGKVPDNGKEPDTVETGEQGLLPELDFSTFILSLSSSVLMNLGVIDNPVTNKKEKRAGSGKADYRSHYPFKREDGRQPE